MTGMSVCRQALGRICCILFISCVYCAEVSATVREIASQPQIWRRAAAVLPTVAERLPEPGRRVAFVGCGTSWFIAQSAAWLREAAGHGESDAFSASELPDGRSYDMIVAISRSGTTTEVVRCLEAVRGTPTVAICAVADTPVVDTADAAIVLDFADETSVVQTRFATAVLALLREHAGQSIAEAAEEAEVVIAEPLPLDPSDFEHFVMLGHGWRSASPPRRRSSAARPDRRGRRHTRSWSTGTGRSASPARRRSCGSSGGATRAS